jgi:hypothetical protein
MPGAPSVNVRPLSPKRDIPGILWSYTPTLGDVGDEAYLGRIVVEVTDDAERVVFIGVNESIARRAAAALQGGHSFPRSATIWPTVPITGAVPSGQIYRGRVILEFWSSTMNIAVSELGGRAAELVLRAGKVLESFPAA